MAATPQRKRLRAASLGFPTPDKVSKEEVDKENNPFIANCARTPKRMRFDMSPVSSLTHNDASSNAFPLLGRETECAVLEKFLRGCFEGDADDRCLYVSGGPGTGKTCSVRAAVRQCCSGVQVFEINCMGLAKRSVAGLSEQLARDCSASMGLNQPNPRSARQSIATGAVLEALKQINRPTVLVVDEVDQLVPRGNRPTVGDLDSLMALPRQLGVPHIAIVMIANAVDLLERANLDMMSRCASLLFEPYTAAQLQQIVSAKLDATNAGTIGFGEKVRIAEVAKYSGDCRQVMSLCEDALFRTKSEGGPGGPTQVPVKSSRNDPLKSVKELPLEQQILLCVLANSQNEAVKVTDVCRLYKQMCRTLKQNTNASPAHIKCALTALEQRGLLSVKKTKTIEVAELSMTWDTFRDALRESIPMLILRNFPKLMSQ